MGGLLFLALAYFAVGQATVNRSGAQTAADAAALAAAQERRDQLAGQWVKDVLDPAKWQRIFDGSGQALSSPCWRASELASRNYARLLRCQPNGPLSYTVDVETSKSMGKSVVPITERKHSKAHAEAVITGRCEFKPLPVNPGSDALPRLTCKGGKYWDIDPKDLTDLPKPQDLFDVHLAD